MKPKHVPVLNFLILSGCVLFAGCQQKKVEQSQQQARQPDAQKIVRSGEPTKEQVILREEVLLDLKDAEKLDPPNPVLEFPVVEGWSAPVSRALPGDGLSVAYEHESRITITLYQFNRGLPYIPSDIHSKIVSAEFEESKRGLAQAVGMGLYDSLELEEAGIVPLGTSSTEAHWIRYLAKRDGMRMATELYIWSYKNRFLKIRLTSNPRRSKLKQAAIEELLSAIGRATEQ